MRTLFEIIVDGIITDDKVLSTVIVDIGHKVAAGDRRGKGHAVEWQAIAIGDDVPPNPGHHKIAELRRAIETCGYVHDGDLSALLSQFDTIVAGYAAAPVSRDEPTKPERAQHKSRVLALAAGTVVTIHRGRTAKVVRSSGATVLVEFDNEAREWFLPEELSP